MKRNSRYFVGQATVEAAVLIPIVLLMLMFLLQPGIILYDRLVMKNAAAEGCRLLSTKIAISSQTDLYEEYIRSRLGSIPQEDHFHIHDDGCSWEISMQGDESSAVVSVEITNKVKPLPFFDFASKGIGMVGEDGFFTIEVNEVFVPKNDWVISNDAGLNPKNWVSQWG